MRYLWAISQSHKMSGSYKKVVSIARTRGFVPQHIHEPLPSGEFATTLIFDQQTYQGDPQPSKAKALEDVCIKFLASYVPSYEHTLDDVGDYLFQPYVAPNTKKAEKIKVRKAKKVESFKRRKVETNSISADQGFRFPTLEAEAVGVVDYENVPAIAMALLSLPEYSKVYLVAKKSYRTHIAGRIPTLPAHYELVSHSSHLKDASDLAIVLLVGRLTSQPDPPKKIVVFTKDRFAETLAAVASEDATEVVAWNPYLPGRP